MLLEKYLYERSLIHEPNPMFFSSFFFLTNVLIAYKYKHNTYSALFFGLFITSIIVHSHDTLITNLVDKLSIAAVVSYGAYTFINKSPSLIISVPIVTTFVSVIYLYIYGYCTKSFCFHEDELTGKIYHSFMHFISSLGHHLIILA